MAILALAIVMSVFSNNADFIQTTNQQLADGYTWAKIECRDTTGDVPALTMATANGAERVCYKLVK